LAQSSKCRIKNSWCSYPET